MSPYTKVRPDLYVFASSRDCVARDYDLLQLLAGDRTDRRYCIGAADVRVQHALLWPLDGTGRAAHQTDTVAGPFRRSHNWPRIGHHRHWHALQAFRRPPVLRAVPAAAPNASGPRPGTGTRGAGHWVRIVPRSGDEPDVVQTRWAVQQPSESKGRQVESRPGQVKSHVHRG